MTADEKKKEMNEMVNGLAEEVAQGVLLKVVKARLERLTDCSELVEKLIRMVEIRSKDLSYYKAK